MIGRPFHPDPLRRMQWAYSQEHLAWAPKAVLVYLAFRDGVACHPSQSSIAKDTKLSVRTVKRCLAYLDAMNYLVRTPRFKGNRRLSDSYELPYEGVIEPAYTYAEWQDETAPAGGVVVAPPARLPDARGEDAQSPRVGSERPTEQEEVREVDREEEQEEREVPVAPASSRPMHAWAETSGRETWWYDGAWIHFDPGMLSDDEERVVRLLVEQLAERIGSRDAAVAELKQLWPPHEWVVDRNRLGQIADALQALATGAASSRTPGSG